MYSADYFISKLGLGPHVEGGYFKETYRNSFTIADKGYKHPIEGNRALSTTIYFLLKSGQVSKFHKLKSDEIWFYHYGCPMVISMISENGEYRKEILGLDVDNGEKPQLLISANTIFGAEPLQKDSFSLVSCMVSPGFDYRDFVLFDEKELLKIYPEHSEIIKRLSKSA